MEKLAISELLVLLVEPSQTQRRIIENQLNDIGVTHTLTATSGESALEEMRSSIPDLIISSLYLPDMTGTDLVHNMRDDAALQGMAFMLVSSETRFRFLDPIRQAGTVAILPKPFTIDELKVALSTAVDHLDGDSLQVKDIYPEELHVLIVDDSRLARNHIRRVLSSMGIERFSEAEDGAQALRMLDESIFDLVVTDYNMPNMDGKELVEHIRSGSGHTSMPVLMVTSEENENRLAAVQQSGVSAICDKPFEPGMVKSLIEQII